MIVEKWKELAVSPADYGFPLKNLTGDTLYPLTLAQPDTTNATSMHNATDVTGFFMVISEGISEGWKQNTAEQLSMNSKN